MNLTFLTARMGFVSEIIDKISHLPLFLQVVLAVIAVGIGFAILKKLIKVVIWLVVIALAIMAYQIYFR
jgi:glucan phosphoethanolaminetransferase (alkaline phosphatase superfamily)